MRSLYPGAVATIALWKSAPVLRRTSHGPPRHCFRHVRLCVRVCKRATGSFSLVKLLIQLRLVKLLVNVNVCPPLLLGDCYTYSDSVDNCGGCCCCCCCDISASASQLQALSPQALTDAHTPSQWSPRTRSSNLSVTICQLGLLLLFHERVLKKLSLFELGPY